MTHDTMQAYDPSAGDFIKLRCPVVWARTHGSGTSGCFVRMAASYQFPENVGPFRREEW